MPRDASSPRPLSFWGGFVERRTTKAPAFVASHRRSDAVNTVASSSHRFEFPVWVLGRLKGATNGARRLEMKAQRKWNRKINTSTVLTGSLWSLPLSSSRPPWNPRRVDSPSDWLTGRQTDRWSQVCLRVSLTMGSVVCSSLFYWVEELPTSPHLTPPSSCFKAMQVTPWSASVTHQE